MLNTDYKIYAKILANRLQVVLPNIIHPDQVGFMRNRSIASNLTELMTIIEYCRKHQIDGVITAVDFEKAFDTISWTAMVKIMSKFGIGQKYIDMVMICYQGFQINISNNGHFTDRLQICRGNKQGCPLSALQFLLVIETIGLKLRQNKDIEHIKIEGHIEKLLSQYADDLWTATLFNDRSFTAQFQIFSDFREFTGLAINYK